ncbi:MAG: Stk1 family PASTA domain-containing Ser/Thr kinase [Jatrophihabitantaceae bacterium]
MTQPRLVGGRYELGELIGYGGMAEVHRGRDSRLGRDVAIKVLRADLARDPSFLHRFRREAQAAAGLNHPSIVSVYDTGEDTGPDGVSQPYIVMEFVEGRTLREILKAEGRLPARRAMEITADICGALDFSHKNGIIHRDVKPANVMITLTGAVKVMDFGIARAVADNAVTQTQTANVIGTAQYLSPEQARGETVDARSDVYSTGCLLYELVTGSPPFQGDSPVAVAYQHVRETAPAPSVRNPDVPRALDSIVMKALAKNQLNRYQSAGEMRSDLQRALANQPVTAESVMTDAERTQFIARTPPPPVAIRRPMDDEPSDDEHRRTGLIWLAVVVAMLLVIGGVTALIFFTKKQDNGPKSVAIPDIIGVDPTAAATQLKQAGFTDYSLGQPVAQVTQCVRTVKSGQVCTVSPGVGQSTPTNTLVTYSVYTQATTQVPPVEGMQFNQAQMTLHTAQLVAKRVPVNDYHPEGYVIKQDPPAYGAPVVVGSTVTLTVSTGVVTLPDVTGKKLAAALDTLNNAKFLNTEQQTKTTPDKAKDGTIADENPTPKIAYPVNTPITLTVYKYQAPPPTCTTVPPASPTSPSGVISTTPGGGTSTPPGATGSASPSGGASSSTLPPCASP